MYLRCNVISKLHVIFLYYLIQCASLTSCLTCVRSIGKCLKTVIGQGCIVPAVHTGIKARCMSTGWRNAMGGVQYHKVWKPGADWVLKNINDSNDVSYLFWNTRCPLQASLCLQDWHARKKATGVFRFLWQASMAMHWWKQLPFERGHSALENGVASMYRIPWLIYLPITQGFIKMLYRIEYVASYTVDRTLAERHSEWWDAFRILIHYLVSASFIHHSNPPFAPLSRWIAHHWSPQQSWSESTVVLNYEIREARSAWAWNILQLEVPPKKCCEVDVCDDYMNPQHSYMPFFKCILRAG